MTATTLVSAEPGPDPYRPHPDWSSEAFRAAQRCIHHTCPTSSIHPRVSQKHLGRVVMARYSTSLTALDVATLISW
ncbi:hypothetical protein VTK26DRAFT_843 [Humicola hyalothermophila]